MTSDDLKAIQETIRITVNGKIDRINDKLDNYIKMDNAWKEEVMPSIELGRTAISWSKGTAYVFAALSGLAAATGGIMAIVHFCIK